jgi:threonine synthase
MKYYSTKNATRAYSLQEAVLMGLPQDNGLFMPERIPTVDSSFINALEGKSLVDIAAHVATKWFSQDVPEEVLQSMVADAYPFDTPVVTLDDRTHILELFHGPTLAFKDVGARFMARLMSWFVKGSDKKLTILVATSGDTGSAVASGFFNVENIDVVILYPSGKVSESQEKQLTTWGNNIAALEVKGTFDDCQRMVKEAFLDPELSTRLSLSSANSINIARLVPQSFYYFRAAAQLLQHGKPLSFIVPSGNFGNLTAGIFAKRMGLPVASFIAATNANDVVPEYLRAGDFHPRKSVSTISNAMDVGNPSNFWRMTNLYNDSLEAMRKDISGVSVTEDETRAAMRSCYDHFNYVIDPHGAVGFHAWNQLMSVQPENAGVILETAHPSKFSSVVEETLHLVPEMPERLAAIVAKQKVSVVITPELSELKSYLLSR